MRYIYRGVNDKFTANGADGARLAYRDMGQTIADRIRERLKAKKLNQRAAALRAGLSDSAVRNILEGKSNSPRGVTLQRLARVLETRVEWLLTGEGEADLDAESAAVVSIDEIEGPPALNPDEPITIGSATGVRGIPLDASPQIDVTAGMGGGGLTIVSEGVPGRHGMTFAAEHVRDYWRLPAEILSGMGLNPKDIAIFPVQGDSMSPTLLEGEFVFVDTRHRQPSPDGLYALSDNFGGVVVKRLETFKEHGSEEIRVRVLSDNPKHRQREVSFDELWVVGRVVRRFGLVT